MRLGLFALLAAGLLLGGLRPAPRLDRGDAGDGGRDGVWRGIASAGGGAAAASVELTIAQEGPRVNGFVRVRPIQSSLGSAEGPVAGDVAGDVLRFSQTDGGVRGEATVTTDQMQGELVWVSVYRLILRRTEPPSPARPREN
jgi:hypothetical protein